MRHSVLIFSFPGAVTWGRGRADFPFKSVSLRLRHNISLLPDLGSSDCMEQKVRGRMEAPNPREERTPTFILITSPGELDRLGN